jgi:hypothetical protein
MNLYSQSFNKGLFLLVDKTNDSIYINDKTNVKIKYTHVNVKQKWFLNLEHIKTPNYKGNHFKYLLPKEMVKEFIRKGNVEEIKGFMRKQDTLSLKNLSSYFKLRYSYFYEYLDKGQFRTQRRYNIFLFFKDDIENDYVTFYEVSLTKAKTKIEEE